MAFSVDAEYGIAYDIVPRPSARLNLTQSALKEQRIHAFVCFLAVRWTKDFRLHVEKLKYAADGEPHPSEDSPPICNPLTQSASAASQ